jgi:hypothetical protein
MASHASAVKLSPALSMNFPLTSSGKGKASSKIDSIKILSLPLLLKAILVNCSVLFRQNADELIDVSGKRSDVALKLNAP